MKALSPRPKRKPQPAKAGPEPSDKAGWRLISGQALAEFVLHSGLVAPRLLSLAPKER